ncbi:MAG: hypothetical protein PHW40_04240, partial [Candidatus Izemoplasmatales bacterium]|nr:hypothetical protein [Candidatus Izemoplasmatales bacterium]
VITDGLVLDNPGHYEIHIHESDLDVAFHVTIESVVDGIANGDDTNEAVIIDAKGNLFLNGAPYVSNTRIDIPGNYELSIQGEGGYEKRIWFTLHASIDNVEEGAWVSGPIRIYSNGTAMLLDEHPYGGHLISDARTYQLEVLGVNGYSRTIEFHITPEVVGIESGATYQDSVDFWVNGNARLNGETITGNVVLTEAGDYELTLYCAETLFQTLHFTLVNPSDESNCSAPFSYWTVLFGVLAAIGLIVLLKKK